MSSPSSSTGTGHILRSIHVECLQGTKVRGSFDEDAVSAIDEQFADQVERLLRTGGDEDVVGIGLDAVASDVAGDHLAQRLIALGRSVLQGLSSVLAENFVARFFEALDRKDIGRGEATTKRNDLRLLRDL